MRGLTALLILALAACTPPAPATFPAGTEMTFMSACQRQGAPEGYCGCVWDRIEAEVPPGEFMALERLSGPEREAHPLTRQIAGYALACRPTSAPAATPVESAEPKPAQ